MLAFNLLLPVVLLVISVSFLQADTIHVPSQQPTIQAGIDGAQEGDTVLVSEGMYYETIDFLGKGIVVRSEEGPLSTMISGALDTLDAAVVSFISGEDSAAVLERFTVKKGESCGIICQSSPLIRDNIIVQNGDDYGMDTGIQISQNAAPTILHNYIGNNGHIGVYCIWGTPLITGNYIVRNHIGIYMGGPSSPRIVDNLIGWNQSDYGDYAGILIEHDASPLIEGNIIVGNNGTNGGYGGVHIHDAGANPVIRRNLILRNSMNDEYGGINWEWGALAGTIENNTIVENGGDGITFGELWGDSITVRNNIISENTGYGMYYYEGTNGDADISYNDIWQNEEGPFGGDAAPDTGNISAGPRFRLSENRDYTLLGDSPCIDAGDPEATVPEDGGDRIDIGAFEYSIPFNDVALTFINVPDTVSAGDTLELEFSLTNPFPSPILIDIWFTASGWSGYLTLREFPDLSVPADTSITASLLFVVPHATQAGQYNLQGKVGYIDEWIADAENAIVHIVQ